MQELKRIKELLNINNQELNNIADTAIKNTLNSCAQYHQIYNKNYFGELWTVELYSNLYKQGYNYYTFREIFDTNLFNVLSSKNYIFNNDNYNILIYNTIETIVNKKRIA